MVKDRMMGSSVGTFEWFRLRQRRSHLEDGPNSNRQSIPDENRQSTLDKLASLERVFRHNQTLS